MCDLLRLKDKMKLNQAIQGLMQYWATCCDVPVFSNHTWDMNDFRSLPCLIAFVADASVLILHPFRGSATSEFHMQLQSSFNEHLDCN